MQYEFNADSIRKLASMLRRTNDHGAAIHCECLLAGSVLPARNGEALQAAVARCTRRAIDGKRDHSKWRAMGTMLFIAIGGGETCTRATSL